MEVSSRPVVEMPREKADQLAAEYMVWKAHSPKSPTLTSLQRRVAARRVVSACCAELNAREIDKNKLRWMRLRTVVFSEDRATLLQLVAAREEVVANDVDNALLLSSLDDLIAFAKESLRNRHAALLAEGLDLALVACEEQKDD
jgi:hypothetical protein